MAGTVERLVAERRERGRAHVAYMCIYVCVVERAGNVAILAAELV